MPSSLLCRLMPRSKSGIVQAGRNGVLFAWDVRVGMREFNQWGGFIWWGVLTVQLEIAHSSMLTWKLASLDSNPRNHLEITHISVH